MDFETLKTKVVEIAEIASKVPEAFREKCFELLLNHLLAGATPPAPKTPASVPPATGGDVSDKRSGGPASVIPGGMKAFMRRTGVTDEELEAVVMHEGDEFHFIKEPSHKNVRLGQNEWALLLALKSGVQTGALSVDTESVRSIAQEKGYYDATNFSKGFKGEPYSGWYKEAMVTQGEAVALSAAGEKALAALIKTLVK